MSNVLKFPVQEPRREPTELEKMVEQELVDLGADVEMARTITQRMERFLELAAFEFDMRMKVSKEWVVTPIDLLMVKFTFYKRSNNLIVHLFAFRKT
ncbi:hypothetical protein ACUHZR_19700, partial [Photobacterium damselae subsp. piscicida]